MYKIQLYIFKKEIFKRLKYSWMVIVFVYQFEYVFFFLLFLYLKRFLQWGYIFFKEFIYLFLESGGGEEKERERNITVWLPLAHPLLGTWPATQACALTGNRTSDPLVHRSALNPLSHTSQSSEDIFFKMGK